MPLVVVLIVVLLSRGESATVEDCKAHTIRPDRPGDDLPPRARHSLPKPAGALPE
jgi:hypothetical protein